MRCGQNTGTFKGNAIGNSTVTDHKNTTKNDQKLRNIYLHYYSSSFPSSNSILRYR